MVLSIRKAAKASYYYQGGGLGTFDAPERGHWLAGDDMLGVWAGGYKDGEDREIRPSVKEGKLAQLLHRQVPDTGATATFSRQRTQTGHDFVFSAPKSVSILWALSGWETRKLIDAAQLRAVRAATALLRRFALKERIGKGGKVLRGAGGAIAAFTHRKSRPARHELPPKLADGIELTFADPNLHTHVVIPDLIASGMHTTYAGSAKTCRLKIAYTALYGRWALAAGAWYHACLAHELRRIGLPLTPSGPNGLFQITGIKPTWISAFSARSAETKALFPDGADRANAFRRTRAPANADDKQLTKLWRAFATRIGVKFKALPQASSPTEPLMRTMLSREECEPLFDAVIPKLTENEAVIQVQDLFRAVASELVAGGSFGRPSAQIIFALLADERLIPLQPTESYALPQWTTAANERDEDAVVSIAETIHSDSVAGVALDEVALDDSVNWTPDQRAAIAACCEGRRLVVVDGAPGTGKTSLLAPVIAAHLRGCGADSVIGAAESWQAALALTRRFGIPAFALANILGPDRKNATRLVGRRLLIVDEAGLIGTKRMRHILELVQRWKLKLIVLGDGEQLKPIAAGAGLSLLRSVLNPVTLSTNVRQESEAQRTTALQFTAAAGLSLGSGTDADRGNVVHALHSLASSFAGGGWVSHGTSEAAVADVVRRLLPANETEGVAGHRYPARIVLVRSHHEAHHITRAMRRELRARDVLVGKDHAFPAVTPMGMGYRLTIAVNDRIRFLKRNVAIGVVNGTTAIVRGIAKAGKTWRIRVEIVSAPDKDAIRKEVTFRASDFEDEKGRLQIASAYAMTIYGCQGSTMDDAIVLRSSRMTFRELYVAATRARRSLTVIETSAKRAKAQQTGDVESLSDGLFQELLQAHRSDRPKLLARDHRHRPNEKRPDGQGWLWEIMTDGSVGPAGGLHKQAKSRRAKAKHRRCSPRTAAAA